MFNWILRVWSLIKSWLDYPPVTPYVGYLTPMDIAPVIEPVAPKPFVERLKSSEVIAIRELMASGEFTQEEVGLIYGRAQQTISDIVNGKTWKGVK